MTGAAVDRLALYFGGEPTRQGLLARVELDATVEGDAALRQRLRADLGADLRPDGSVGGAALPTIWRAHELLDLGEPAESPRLQPLLSWILRRQGRPGAFGEGCDRERHARQACEHFLAGFVAPAPPAERLAPITLPNGKPFRAEAAARFALSCLALRAVLRAGQVSAPAVGQHVRSLVRLSQQWTEWGGYFAPDMIVAGLHALAAAGAEGREPVQRLTALVVAHQDRNGDWPHADSFHVLEALLAAGGAEAEAAIARAAPRLEQLQRPDGTFGSTARQERALIGLRALLRARRSR